jgi:hypothetical protein
MHDGNAREHTSCLSFTAYQRAGRLRMRPTRRQAERQQRHTHPCTGFGKGLGLCATGWVSAARERANYQAYLLHKRAKPARGPPRHRDVGAEPTPDFGETRVPSWRSKCDGGGSRGTAGSDAGRLRVESVIASLQMSAWGERAMQRGAAAVGIPDAR